jgi:hypothetical protein
MAKCQNCGATMSCGCQKRTSADGKVGCTKCIADPRPGVKPEPAKTKSINLENPIDPFAPVINNAVFKV